MKTIAIDKIKDHYLDFKVWESLHPHFRQHRMLPGEILGFRQLPEFES